MHAYARNATQQTGDGGLSQDVEIQGADTYKEAETDLTRSNRQKRREYLPSLWSGLLSFWRDV